MPHPEISNPTPFTFEPLFLADEELRPALVLLFKATFEIRPGRPDLVLADEQAPIELAGVPWGDPATSSHKLEPETAIEKPGTDVVLIAHAHPPEAGLTGFEVGLRAGPLKKTARVIGDRVWRRRFGIPTKSSPAAIDAPIPLLAERAFGGRDERHPNPARHGFEPRNPVGVGYHHRRGRFVEGTPLPNIEDPRRPIRLPTDRPAPALFGFTCPHWEPRRRFAGTYDARWERERKPLLPKDFDRRFFQAAPPDLISSDPFRGDEPVVTVNASRHGTLSFHLPGLPHPRARVRTRRSEKLDIATRLDTVIIDTDAERVFLLFRGHTLLRDGPPDVRAIEIDPVASAIQTRSSPSRAWAQIER